MSNIITVKFGDGKSKDLNVKNMPVKEQLFIKRFCTNVGITEKHLRAEEKKQLKRARKKALEGENPVVELELTPGEDVNPTFLFYNYVDFFDHYISGTEKRRFWLQYEVWHDMLDKFNRIFLEEHLGKFDSVQFWDLSRVRTYELGDDGLLDHSDENYGSPDEAISSLLNLLKSKENNLFICKNMDVILSTNQIFTGPGLTKVLHSIQNIFDDEKLKDNNSRVIFTGNAQKDREVPTILQGYFVKFKESTKELPTLYKYSRDITAEARSGKIGNIIGRENEISELLSIFQSDKYNNAIITARPGVGKTALIEGLALAIVNGEVPEELKNLRIFELDYNKFRSSAAGLGDSSEFRKRFDELIKEVRKNRKLVLIFIDEFHKIMNDAEILSTLKPHLAKGFFPMIGATTSNEFQRFVAREDKAFVERFHLMNLEELPKDIVMQILDNIVSEYNEKYNFSIAVSEHLLEYMYTLCKNLTPLLALPRSGEKLIRKIIEKMSDKEEITKQLIDSTFPAGKIKNSFKDKNTVKQKINRLKETIIGQDKQIENIVKNLSHQFFKLCSIKHPVSLMFLGPTGVGKTQLAIEISKLIWGDEDHYVTINMGAGRGATAFAGADPGYVGYTQPTPFQKFINEHETGIIILDEFEKIFEGTFGQGDVQTFFLDVLDKGRFNDNQGNTVDSKSFIFILTTNFGKDYGPSTPKTEIVSGLREIGMRPEFAGRISDFIIFNPMTVKVLKGLTDKILSKYNNAPDFQTDFKLDNSFIQHIVEISDYKTLGARNFENNLENAITEIAFENQEILEKKDIIIIKYNKEENKYEIL